jgi:hypothetical protein
MYVQDIHVKLFKYGKISENSVAKAFELYDDLVLGLISNLNLIKNILSERKNLLRSTEKFEVLKTNLFIN